MTARWRPGRTTVVLALLGGLLLAACFATVGVGAVAVAPGEVLRILAGAVGIETGQPAGITETAVVTEIRLPRLVLGLLVGAGLAVSGAAMQGLFRNPLADPQLIGVSTGAALAAVVTIVLGAALLGQLPFGWRPFVLPATAFLGGLATTSLVFLIARRDGHSDVATMLLAGIAMNAIAAAGVGLMIFLSTDQQLRDINFWMLGSLGGATWTGVGAIAGPVLLAVGGLLSQARFLNAMLLGEEEARHLGLDVERGKRICIALVALATGAGVALTGVIAFVGLVAPHIVRLTAGPDHRLLLPAAALLGPSLLLGADLLARTVAVPAELPIGIVMAGLGGPFFIWILLRRGGMAGW